MNSKLPDLPDFGTWLSKNITSLTIISGIFSFVFFSTSMTFGIYVFANLGFLLFFSTVILGFVYIINRIVSET